MKYKLQPNMKNEQKGRKYTNLCINSQWKKIIKQLPWYKIREASRIYPWGWALALIACLILENKPLAPMW